MGFKRLLVPMDFSQNSINSLKCAVEFAKVFGSKITVLHAYYLSDSYAQEAYISYLASIAKDITERIEQDFDKIIAELHAQELVDKKLVRYAGPVDAIIDVAKEESVDMIVLGRSGTNKLIDKTMGTVAYLVMKNAECPVLAVPESVGHIDYSKIMFAAEFGKPWNEKQVVCLKHLADKLKANITVVNVEKEGGDVSVENLADRMNEVRDLMTGIEHSFEVVKQNDVEAGLNAFIEEHNVTVMAMIPQKHSFLESVFQPSVTRRMTLHLSIPLLALK